MADNTDTALRSLLFYQVFVRNYGEAGSFAAVERDLPRIRDLGADVVYLMPIHPVGEKCRKGSLGSPYAVRNYRAVNPEFGTLDDFRRLTDAIHAQGMKCMIDVVFNHTSPDAVLVSEHPEWYCHRADGSFYNRVGEWSDVVDLDYDQPALWAHQIDTLKYWAGMVDGFRCDVAPLLPLAFWERARREVAAVRPDCMWLAESADPGFIAHLRSRGLGALSDGELYRAFDITYDYDSYWALNRYLTGKGTLEAYVEDVNRQEAIFPANYVKLRFLENHDQARAASLAENARALRNLTAFMLFQKGSAFVYAGQEFGATHRPTLFDHDPVRLAPENGVNLTELIRKMMRIKKKPLFQNSACRLTVAEKDVLLAEHSRDGERVMGVFSLKGRAGQVTVPLRDGVYEDLLSGEFVEVFRSVLYSDEPMILKIKSGGR